MINSEQLHEAQGVLLNFVYELHDFLRRFVNEPYDRYGKLLVLKEMQEELRNAWKEFDEDFNLDKAKNVIYEASPERLQTHGLYGSQLRAKISLFQIRIGRFFDSFTTKGLLKLIDAADTLVDSIIAATGLDEALKEMKDLLRNSVDEE
jgi:hypothetical protein